jgi:hypothetical protein
MPGHHANCGYPILQFLALINISMMDALTSDVEAAIEPFNVVINDQIVTWYPYL